jgi:hypothetical protein
MMKKIGRHPREARGRAVTTRPSRTKPDGLKHAVPSLAEE